MKNPKNITALVLIAGSLLATPPATHAAPDVVPVEGVYYNVNATISNNLRQLKGRRINITLDSGKIIAGNLKDVGDKLVHLEKVEGREYYDALVRIESINSVDTRFRTIRR